MEEKIKWMTAENTPISCAEKLKVLNQNLEEILSVYKDCLEDAILFGVSPKSFREIIISHLISKTEV